MTGFYFWGLCSAQSKKSKNRKKFIYISKHTGLFALGDLLLVQRINEHLFDYQWQLHLNVLPHIKTAPRCKPQVFQRSHFFAQKKKKRQKKSKIKKKRQNRNKCWPTLEHSSHHYMILNYLEIWWWQLQQPAKCWQMGTCMSLETPFGEKPFFFIFFLLVKDINSCLLGTNHCCSWVFNQRAEVGCSAGGNI